mmetsp:Transcript_24449/g.31874  ORF Transcript_24449/g.31874 Transcript_24449/m.31874 type:complete len:348 (-) Transcript_24449:69-1112(-)
MASHCKQRRTTDEGLGRLFGHTFPIGQHGCGEIKRQVFLAQTTKRTGRPQPHGNFAFFEGGLVVAPTGAEPFEITVVFPVFDSAEMRFDRVIVDQDLSVGAVIAVVVGCERQVVAGVEVFGKDPGQVRLGQGGIACLFQSRSGDCLEFFPGFRCAYARFFQRLNIEIHDRRGGVERHTDHLAIAVGVEIAHTSNVVVDVKINTVVGQQILNRNGCTLGTDHRCSTGIEHLHHIGLLACAEGRDASGEGLFIGALENRGDLVFILACVEVGRDLVDGVTQRAAHGVPPGNFCFSKSSIGSECQRGSGCKRNTFHLLSPVLRHPMRADGSNLNHGDRFSPPRYYELASP